MQVQAQHQISALLKRTPAARVKLEVWRIDEEDDAESLLIVLRELGAADQVDALATRIVTVVTQLTRPSSVSRILVLLQRTGCTNQAQELQEKLIVK